MKLWRNSARHLCSVIAVAQWWFDVFRHRYSYKHDDFAHITELIQPAFQRTRVWWRGRHVYDDEVDTCMMGRLTRVWFHGWHVAFSCAFTWQHASDDEASVTQWRLFFIIEMSRISKCTGRLAIAFGPRLSSTSSIHHQIKLHLSQTDL